MKLSKADFVKALRHRLYDFSADYLLSRVNCFEKTTDLFFWCFQKILQKGKNFIWNKLLKLSSPVMSTNESEQSSKIMNEPTLIKFNNILYDIGQGIFNCLSNTDLKNRRWQKIFLASDDQSS